MKYISRLRARLREMAMAKNARKKGRSARNGNRPAPYTKYNKSPFRYSPDYYSWKAKITGRAQRHESRV